MLEQRRLDTCLYDAIVKHVKTGKLPEDKDMLVATGFAAFNGIYGEPWARCRLILVRVFFLGENQLMGTGDHLLRAKKTPLMLA